MTYFIDSMSGAKSYRAMIIHVTRPFLPPLEEFLPSLERIWESRILSNGGPNHIQLEAALCATLKVKHVSLFNNGSLALLAALRALDLQDAEIITTPYSFVATSNMIVWGGNTPVFVDIEPGSTNIDPAKIEAAITPKTKAILAVHCYGHPCNTHKIAAISSKHNLKVVYDAAHAFGIETEGSILNYGDLSILSFHATKVFNTFEGGAIICHTPEMKVRIDRMKNFGFLGETQVDDIGINAKMPEINAALGLLQLKYFEKITAMRAAIDTLYRTQLQGVSGIKCLENCYATKRNYAYFPVRVMASYPMARDELYELLKTHGIYARRYFYPLISQFKPYFDFPSSAPRNLPVAMEIAEQILCLPMYPELSLKIVKSICEIIRSQK